jgi:hypothetical protein
MRMTNRLSAERCIFLILWSVVLARQVQARTEVPREQS